MRITACECSCNSSISLTSLLHSDNRKLREATIKTHKENNPFYHIYKLPRKFEKSVITDSNLRLVESLEWVWWQWISDDFLTRNMVRNKRFVNLLSNYYFTTHRLHGTNKVWHKNNTVKHTIIVVTTWKLCFGELICSDDISNALISG